MVGFLGVGKIALRVVVHRAFVCSLIMTMLQLTLLMSAMIITYRCTGK